jgi:Fe-coproporphyrin III synthase
MDLTIISTYRCNSKCSMCYTWKHPTLPKNEVSLDVLQKLPGGFDNLNITGGEPTLRQDLLEVVDVLYPKARKLEISSNGLLPEKLEPVIRKYPDVKIRFSLEGFKAGNDRVRGEDDGFNTKVNGLKRLKELGGCDLGFATVIQDDNAADLTAIYHLTQEMGVELATSALHNAFQFHKADNFPYDRKQVAKEIEKLIVEMLRTNTIKNWFRAYLNLGLIEKVLGQDRLIACTAGTDFVFVDPWSDVYACNVRPDLQIGNLQRQSWDEIYHGQTATNIRGRVSACQQNCWMVGSARTAMRNPHFTRLPKWNPLWWVVTQKARVTLGLPVNFERMVNYSQAAAYPAGPQRASYLGAKGIKRDAHDELEGHYNSFGDFNNR